jgi:hypothetical protein
MRIAGDEFHQRQDESKTVILIRTYAEEQPMVGYRIIAAMIKYAIHHDGGYYGNKKGVVIRTT